MVGPIDAFLSPVLDRNFSLCTEPALRALTMPIASRPTSAGTTNSGRSFADNAIGIRRSVVGPDFVAESVSDMWVEVRSDARERES